jgi:hypothetical protein
MRYIFDLDGTVIDSSHRKATLPDGSLDLAGWIANSTPEKIRRDSLLPLAAVMRELFPNSEEMLICTARVMGEADLEYLAENGLFFDGLLSRPEGNRLPDHVLKEMLLRDHATRCGLTWEEFTRFAHMFDDNAHVIETLQGIGLSVSNAITLNAELS